MHKQFQEEVAKDAETIGIKPAELATLSINTNTLDKLVVSIPEEQATLQFESAANKQQKAKHLEEQAVLNAKLNEPQLLYQKYLKVKEVWESKLKELTGASDEPDTLNGLKARIAQLESLPNKLDERRIQRLELTGEIFDVLNGQRNAREQLFKPVQDLIQGNSLIREDYKLQFQATLGGSPDIMAGTLFTLIKQNSGDFRGEDESYGAVRRIAEKYSLNKRDDVLNFVTELHAKIEEAASGNSKGAIGISSILRKDKIASDVYDLLFGLSFLEPRYSLLFQDAQIEQLSPGQRGALLLIFYLLVDKGRNPIILDQPEENLDNETVVSLLAPVLSEAKKSRQIIMVTHNPNLAVFCDAEQIIYSSFDRQNDSKIAYMSGAIENPVINSHVVNVLEGTKPAFNNRRIKYD